jgi:flagellar hook protein FlgE
MEIGSSFTSGVNGFSQASNQITEETININRQAQQALAQDPNAEDQVAQQAPPAKSLESSVVNLTSQLSNAQANVKAIETADEVLGSIIDVRI